MEGAPARPVLLFQPTLLETMTHCANQLGSHAQLMSRAFHDTGFMGQKFPVAMMFVPSENGCSHCPEESPPDDIEARGQLLTQTLLELADAQGPGNGLHGFSILELGTWLRSICIEPAALGAGRSSPWDFPLPA